MSIVFADNFSQYGTNLTFMKQGVYAEVGNNIVNRTSLANDPDGVSTGKVLLMTHGYGGGSEYQKLRYVLPTQVATAGCAVRVWLPTLPFLDAQAIVPIQWKSDTNVILYSLVVTPTGRISFRVGGFHGTEVYITDNPVITPGAWYHIEAKLTCDATAGSIEVRVEGDPVLNHDTINTGSTLIAQIEQANDSDDTSNGTDIYFKDLVHWDGLGSRNNNFLGSVFVATLSPDADVALNWTPSTGSNGWSILDNIPPDDTKYITAEDSPLPSPYVADMTSLPAEVTAVRGLITWVRAAKVDGGDATLQTSIISNGAPGNGTDRPITISQTYWRDVFEVNPDTATTWSVGAVNAAQLQLNRTS